MFATRGNARIRWEQCSPRWFLDQPLFLEAANSGQVHTLKDLAAFLDGTDVLSCTDDVCIKCFLEINRNLYDVEGCPRIFYAETIDYEDLDTYTAYSVLEFVPGEDVLLGYLHPDAPDDESVIPDMNVWVCASIKSML